MSDVRNRSHSSARRSDYVWQYEYYDDEVPVSFEGLRAHRYSIVIGFWVGLAVFVIFMFFVLTLLTKTGAPHQENPDSAEQRHRPGSRLADATGTQEESDKAFSRPLLAESGSYFCCYIDEESRGKPRAEDERAGKPDQPGTCSRATGRSFSGMDGMEEDAEERRPLRESDKESVFFSNFNLPNFVNLEHGSAPGEDDLLDEPPGVLESRCQPAPL